MKEIKLVIWDLDDTFWHGTLSEGSVILDEFMADALASLTDRGIMNSIVSKNDYNQAMDKLKNLIPDMYSYFVFSSIDWTPKGQRVKRLLEQIRILPGNALMIDDNLHNLEEIRFYNPEINCVTPEEFKLILGQQQFMGKDDKNHSRLIQYKNLEKRESEREKYISNEDFLKSANIKIEVINNNLEKEFDRVYELVHRTNQLNYTKLRSTKNELLDLLNDKDVQYAYIRTFDNYGDYGICGFYAVKFNKLIHFLFSCRILGMGIEQYIYSYLGFPELEIVGEVATTLNDFEKPDWVTVTENTSLSSENIVQNISNKILLVGGCDLEQTSSFLENNGFSIKKEFNTIIDGREYRSSDSCQIINSIKLSETLKCELCSKLPFYNEKITFATSIFNNKYGVVVYSVVDDYIRGIYRLKNNPDICVGYAGYFDQDEWLNKIPREELKWLFENFDYIGREPSEMFEKNLREIADMIDGRKLILINGPDIDVSELIGEDRIQRNVEMNSVVDKIVSQYKNLYLLDMRLIVKNREDVLNDNRHFNRNIYYKMYEELTNILKQIEKE